MKIFTGYAFTEEPILHLKEKGFVFHKIENTEKHGYQSYVAAFANDVGFEIREILEEEEYLKFNPVKSFKPTQTTQNIQIPVQKHLNTVISFLGLVDTETTTNYNEITNYFKIRKASNLWALRLECQNFKLFNDVSKPDRTFDLNGQTAALIHLGPNCFDLLVTQVD